MKIQGEAHVAGMAVTASDGRRLGRVAGVECRADPYSPDWFVVRLPGWRQGLRAVPARQARWCPGGGLRVPYRRDAVLASPALTGTGLRDPASRRAVESFYAGVHAGD